MPSYTVRLSFARGEDVSEGEPHRRVRSHQDHVPDLPPNLARRKQDRDLVDDESVLSQSDDSKTLDSQDYESEHGQDDLRNLDGNELARTFDNEVCLYILTQYEIIQLYLGCSMDTTAFAICPASLP